MTNFSGKPIASQPANAAGAVAEASASYIAHSAREGLNPVLAGMVCPPGYKQTEVGVIPEGWLILTLEDMAISGGLVRGPFGGAIKKEHFVKSGFKVYEQRNAIYATLSLGEYYIDKNKFLELRRFSVQENDFIVSCSGTIGKIFQIPADAPEGVINQALLKITLKDSISLEYFIQYFKWDKFQEKIIDGTQGGAMKNLVGMAEFKNSLMPMPSAKSEQAAIANTLSDVDALISELKKLIDKKQAIKTATMQQLLTGRTRLPQFALREDGSRKGTKPSELGEIPEDWEVVSLGDVATFANGKPYEDFVAQDGSYQLITLDSVSIDGELKKKHKAVNFYDGSLLKGDLVCVLSDIAHARLLGLCGLIETDGMYVLNQRMGRIRFNSRAEPKFMRYLINANQEFFRNRGQGSSQRHIYKQDVFELSVALPNRSEQTSTATILSDMDEELQALEQRLSKTRQIKQGMMQELLTGRTRLV